MLSVNGTGGADFSELRYIRFMEKGFTIYIQTDKAIYKPGQNGKNWMGCNLFSILSWKSSRQDSARLISSRIKKILLTVILQDFCYTCMDLIDMYMHIVSYIADD